MVPSWSGAGTRHRSETILVESVNNYFDFKRLDHLKQGVTQSRKVLLSSLAQSFGKNRVLELNLEAPFVPAESKFEFSVEALPIELLCCFQEPGTRVECFEDFVSIWNELPKVIRVELPGVLLLDLFLVGSHGAHGRAGTIGSGGRLDVGFDIRCLLQVLLRKLPHLLRFVINMLLHPLKVLGRLEPRVGLDLGQCQALGGVHLKHHNDEIFEFRRQVLRPGCLPVLRKPALLDHFPKLVSLRSSHKREDPGHNCEDNHSA